MDPKKPDTISGAAQAVVEHNVATLEAGVDTAMQHTKEAIRQLGDKAEEAVDHAFNHLEQQRPKIEQYIAAHPWLILGGLVVAGYLISGIQRVKGEPYLRRGEV